MGLSHGIQTNQTLFLRKRLMLTLISLPYEVLSNIVANVNFSDVFNLGRTCTELSFLLREESICKSIVQVIRLHFQGHVSAWHSQISSFQLLTNSPDENPVFQ
jgi:hypothetical protein